VIATGGSLFDLHTRRTMTCRLFISARGSCYPTRGCVCLATPHDDGVAAPPAMAQSVHARSRPGGDRRPWRVGGADGATRCPRYFYLGPSRRPHHDRPVLQAWPVALDGRAARRLDFCPGAKHGTSCGRTAPPRSTVASSKPPRFVASTVLRVARPLWRQQPVRGASRDLRRRLFENTEQST
jgi:hypothetical protein